MKRLSISLPDEAYDRLLRRAEEDRRSVAGTAGLLVERALAVQEAGIEARRKLEALDDRPVKAPRRSIPVGGQDAASGALVEARLEPVRQEDEPDPAVLAAAKANTRPRDHVVIGGPDCTHPERFKLGRRCEAPGCGKVVER